ncbi:glycosyltransferase family 2 protein [Tellurirhabdus bombi]|uniref:glycosyltransferase family 2 protein n=1 Tax=Tellurirhabdus bombi TaxID=2907205 RepID=UPI001F40F6EF|nr:glycosyltransferase family 2 protein [Tellurirhabdus bombi]
MATHPVPAISAVLITFNAARLLAEVLSALHWCDEIVVVDSGSKDDTLEIAQKYGCRILHRSFDGFGPQKQYAVAQARNHWVLALDADEIVPDALKQEIIQQVALVEAGEASYQGFEIPRSLVFLGQLMRYGGEARSPILRLFDKRHGTYNTAPVHEKIVLEGSVRRLKNHLLHDSYGSLHDYFDKFNAYTSAAANELFERKKKKSTAKVILRFPLTFLKEYFLKQNFLNGYPGFVWALFSALYPVVKYAKLNELTDKEYNKKRA